MTENADLLVIGDFIIAGSTNINGGSSITFNGNVTINGTLNASGATLTFSDYSSITIASTGTLTANSISNAKKITNSGTIKTANLTANILESGTTENRAGTLEITDNGTLTIANPDDPTSWLNNVVIDSGKTLILANNITVYGDWTNNNETGGLNVNGNTVTFAGENKSIGGSQIFANAVFSGTGAVITGANTFTSATFSADTTISGNNTFTNFICETGGATLTFGAGKTQTVTGNFTITGASADSPVTLQSSASGSEWRISALIATASVSYATVSDSVSTNYAILAQNSVDSGNNTSWNFEDFTYTWTGASSSSPTEKSNWSPASLPGTKANVLIPDSTTDKPISNYPEFSLAATSEVKTLTIGTAEAETHSAYLHVAGDGDLKISGTLTNYGTIKYSGYGEIVESSGTFLNDVVNNGTVEYLTTAGTLSISDFGDVDYANLVISGAWTLDSPISVAGKLTVSGTGALDGANSLSVSGNAEISGAIGSNTPLSSLSVVSNSSIEANVSVSGALNFGVVQNVSNSVTLTANSIGVSGSSSFADLTIDSPSVTFSEGNSFGNLKFNSGCTAKFGAGKIQTVTGTLASFGTVSKPNTLTTDSGSAWWILNIPSDKGKAISSSDFTYTTVAYSKSENDIVHEWASSISESPEGSTSNWFSSEYYWLGGTDETSGSKWEVSANWKHKDSSGSYYSVRKFPTYSTSRNSIFIATGEGNKDLVLEANVSVKTLTVNASKTLNVADKAVSVVDDFTNNGTVISSGAQLSATTITNNGTFRLTGSETISGTMENGAGSTVSYYGSTISSLPWDGNSTAEGKNYQNLVFESGAAGSVSDKVSVTGTTQISNGTGNTISLTGANTFTNGVTITSGGAITLNSSGNLLLGTSINPVSCGSLNLLCNATSQNTMTISNALSLADGKTLTASGSISCASLTNGGTITAQDDVTSTGITNNGTIDIGGNTLSFASYQGNSGGTDIIKANGGTISARGTDAITIGNLESSGISTLNNTGAGVLTVSSFAKSGDTAGTLVLNGGNSGITLSSATYGGTAITGTGKLTLAGTTDSDSMGNFTIGKDTTAGNVSVSGALNGAGLSVNVGSLTLGGNTSLSSVSIASGATLEAGEISTDAYEITVAGSWTNSNASGGFTAASTVTFTGNGVTVSGNQIFEKAVFTGTNTTIDGNNTFNTAQFSASTTISGSNTFTNFTCEAGGVTLTFGDNTTQTVTENLTLKGISESSRLILSGTGKIIVPKNTETTTYTDFDYLLIGNTLVIAESDPLTEYGAYSVSRSLPTVGTEKLNYFALYKNGWDLGYDFVYEWVGADENWSNDSNWDLGLAPGITSKQTTGAKVLIPDGLEKYPSIDVAGVSLTSLVIGTSTESAHDSSIKLTSNALTVTDLLENYGTVNYGGSGRITNGTTAKNDVTNGGTVEYSGSGQTVTDFSSSETDYANLLISGTAESGGNLVVSENLTVGAGASLSQKHNLNLAGNLSIGNTSSFEVDSGKTVLFDGSLGQTISVSSNATKAEFANLEIGENSSVSTVSSFTVSGNWTNSGSFSATDGTITFTGENALISGNSTFKNFTCETDGATLTFADNTTQTVTGNLVLKGASGSPLTLSSSNVCHIDVNHENLTADFLSIGSKIIIMEDLLPVNGSHDAIDSEPSSGTSQYNYLALYKNGWNLGYEFTFTWTGDDSSIPMSWNAKENWDIGMIPGQTSNESPASKVVIPSGLEYYPVLDETTSGIDSLYIKSLKIESGASLKLLSTNLAVTDGNGNHQFENSGTIEFAGDARITDSDTTPSPINDVSHGGTVIYSGGMVNPQSVTDFGTTDYANLVISGIAVSDGELSVSGGLSIGTGGSLSAGENGVISVAGSFENSGTFTGSNGSITISGDYLGTGGSFKASSGTTSFAGNVDLSGTTFSANGGTVAFNGTGSQTLTAKTDGSTTFNAITIEANSSVSTASSFTVAGNWSNGNTSEIGFSATGGTISFTGEDVTITGNNTFTNFTCETNGSLLSIGGTQKITGNLTLKGGEDTLLSLVGNGKFVVTGGSSSFEGENLSIGSDVKIQKDSGTLIAGAFVVTKSSPASPDIAAIISNGWKFEAVLFTWLGTDPSSPTDWATPANWNPALVPGSANFEDSLVNIPGGISNYPNVGNVEYKISSLKIGSEALTDAKIVIGTVDLTVTDALENYGTINYGGSGRITDGGTTPSPINDPAHGGTVEYSGGVAGSPQSVTDFGEAHYANLVISGIAESDGNLVVSGNLTLEAGGSLSQRHNLNLAGNLSIGGSSSFAVDSGKTVLFDGTLGQIISVSSNATKAEFANLEIGTNSSVSTESSFTVTGNWSNSNSSGSGFSASGGTITFTGANMTVSGDNSFNKATFSATTTLSGNNTFTDFTCTTGGITLTVGGTQTVSGRLSLSGSSEAGNLLTVSGTGSFDSSTDDGRYIGTYLSIGNDIKIKNNSALTPRTFVATNSSIVDGATLAFVVANGWKFNGLSYKWVGTTAEWNTASNWDIGIVPDSTASVTYDLSAVAQPVFGGDVSIENITIPAGKSLSLNGHHFTVSGDFSNSGTIILTGTETVTFTENKVTESGTWHYSGTESGIVKPIDNLDYKNLVISGTIGVADGYTITASDGITIGTTTESAAISCLGAVHFGSAVTVAGDSMITSSTDKNILFSSDVTIAPSKTLSFGGTNDDYSVSISGDFTNSGTLVPNKSTVSFAGTSQTITADSATTFCNVQIEENSSLSTESSFTVAGNWRNKGIFTATAGTITFKGENATLSGDNIFSTAAFSASTTVSGSNSFTDFICETSGVILTFGDGKTQTVNGNFTVAGDSSENPVTLQSSVSGKEWTISAPVGTSSVSFAKIKDSVSVNDSILAENSLDEGNNTFWNFKGFEYTWNGAADSDWQKKSNWSPASVPGKLANATIPDSNATSIISNYPAINVATEIANLTIGTQSAGTHTASVKLDSSLSENFKVSGTFSNYGTIEYAGSARITDGIKPINDASNDGTVVYSGGTTETPQIVTDFGETDYAKLVIRGSVSEKSDADYKFVSLVHIESGDKILLSGANVFAGGVSVTVSGSSVTLNASENYDLDLSGESDVAVCKNLDLTGAGVVTAKSDITVSENLTNASTLSLDGHALSFGSYTGETDGSDSVVLDGNTLTATGLAGTIGRLESSGSSTLNNTGNGALTLSSFVKSGDMAGTLALNGGTPGITISSATYGGTVITGTGKLTLAGTTDSDSMGNFTVGDGTTAGNVSVGGALNAADLSVNAGSLTLGGDTNLSSVTIASNAVLKAGGSENSSNKITVGGNWTNNAGTSGFVAQKGTVTFTGIDVTVSGGNTFNDVSFSTGGAAVTFADENAFASLSFLGAGTTANFVAGKTQTVNGNLTLKGESENLITLTGESEWEIKPSDNSEISVAYTKIMNSNNTRATPIIVYAKGGYNVDGTGNTNWIFAGQEYVWTGADENSPTEWNSLENWNPKSVPTKYSDVKINAVFSKNYPVLTSDVDLANDSLSLTVDLDGDGTPDDVSITSSVAISENVIFDFSGKNLTVNSLTSEGRIRVLGNEKLEASGKSGIVNFPVDENFVITGIIEYYGNFGTALNWGSKGNNYKQLEFTSGAKGSVSDNISVTGTTLIANGSENAISLTGDNSFGGLVTIGNAAGDITLSGENTFVGGVAIVSGGNIVLSGKNSAGEGFSLSGGTCTSLEIQSSVSFESGFTSPVTFTGENATINGNEKTFGGATFSGNGATLNGDNTFTDVATFNAETTLSGGNTFADAIFAAGSTFSGNNTFTKFTCTTGGVTLTFAHDTNQTVNKKLTLRGEAGNHILLTGESEWKITPPDDAAEISIAYVTVKNSHNIREAPIIVYAKDGFNTDGTGNTNWFFAGQEYVWTGADENSPTEWNSSENWNPKSVPTKYSDVKINAVFSKNYPVLTSDVDLANDSLSLTVDLDGDGTPDDVSITSSVAISENVIFDFSGKNLTVNSLTSEGRIRVLGNEKLEASGKSGIVNFPVDENFVITGIIEYYGDFGEALNWGSKGNKYKQLEFTSGANGSVSDNISVTGSTLIANGSENAISLIGANTFGGLVTIGNSGTAAGDITLSGGNTFTGGVSIVSGGAIVIKGEKDSGNPMEFLGTSSCGELTVESGVVLNGNISTEGSQIYKGDVVSAVSALVLASNSSYILASGTEGRKWSVKEGGSLRFESDVFVDLSSATLTLETDLDFEKNLVLYSGKISAGDVKLSIEKDLVLFGSSYSASDQRFSGTNTRFAYYGYEYSESPLAYKPEAGTSGFAGEFDTNGTKISVGGNFYANGLDLADCNFSLLDNSGSKPVFNSSSSVTKDQWGLPYAVVFNSTVSNCKAQASGGSVFVTAAAYQGVIDGSNNSGFQFNIPKISGAYSVSDSVICLSFDMDLENSNREVQTAVAMVTSLMDGGIFYNGGTLAFDGYFYTKTDGTDCSVPLSDSSWAFSDIPAGTKLYLKVSSPANTWNTDATASSKGNDDSSDRSGAHRTNTIDLSLFEGLFYAAEGKTMSRNYGVGLWKEESESSYLPVKAFPTIDMARPVLVDVFTGQELHSTNIGSAESQKVYDSHNFIEFRYSEPVDIGDMTSGAETDNQNIRAEKDFDSASSHGGAISKNGTGLSVAGFASIAEGSLTAGFRDGDSHKTDSAKPHALYRKFSRSAISSEEVQPCRIRISVAGFVDTENPYTIDGKSFNNWVGYIDSSESPAGHVTPVANPYIYDLAKDSDGNLLKNTLDENNSSREIEVNSASSSISSDCEPGSLSSLYGSWDCTPPSFAPYITSADGTGSTSWNEGDNDTRTYEIVGMVESNTSAYLEHVEFHLFDNQPEYKAGDEYKWVSQFGWYENGSKLDNHLAPETTGGGKPYSNGSNMTSGGIRRSSLSGAREAFEYSYSTDESHSSYREFGSGEIFQHVKSSLYRSEEKTSTSTDDDGLYIALYLNEKDVKLPMRTSFTVKYHPEKSFITDLAGNRLIQTDDGSSVKTLHSVDITPPSFSIVLSPIGEKKIYMVFTKALAYDGVLLQNQSNLDSVLEKIRSNIEFVYSEDDDIDTTKTLSGDDVIEIEKVELASYSTDYTSLLFTLDRNISLNDVEKIWLRINGEGDEVETFAGKIIASYFRDTTENSIPFHTCHSISDFAVNAVNVLYARSSSDDGWDEHEIYGAGLAPNSSDYAAHDFSADGANYAKLRSGHDIVFQLQLVGGVNSDGKYGFKNNEGLSLVIDRKSDLKNEWISDKFNLLTQKDWRIWLDSKLLSLATSYNPSPLSGTPEFEKVSGSELLENMTIKNSDYNFVNKEEYQFFFKILGEDGNPIELDHDGDKTTPKIPLYSFWMPQDKISSGDYSFLDLWSFSISSITQQRGGVTILNNVINAGIGEKTAIEVEMPSSGNLNVFVMTLDGNIVQRLSMGHLSAGKHYFYWDGKNKGGSPVARGLYFVRVIGKGIDETRKVMVVK